MELLLVLLILAILLGGIGLAAKLAWLFIVAACLAIVIGWGLAFGGRRR